MGSYTVVNGQWTFDVRTIYPDLWSLNEESSHLTMLSHPLSVHDNLIELYCGRYLCIPVVTLINVYNIILPCYSPHTLWISFYHATLHHFVGAKWFDWTLFWALSCACISPCGVYYSHTMLFAPFDFVYFLIVFHGVRKTSERYRMKLLYFR